MKNLLLGLLLISANSWAVFPAGWFYCSDEQFFATGRFTMDSCPSFGTGSLFIGDKEKIGSSKMQFVSQVSTVPGVASVAFTDQTLQGRLDFNEKNHTVKVTLNNTTQEFHCLDISVSGLEGDETKCVRNESHQCSAGKKWMCDGPCSTNCGCRVVF